MAERDGATTSQPTPSVIVSHLDIVYRVWGSTGRLDGRRGPFRRGARAARSVHAVRDVSFVANHGEAIGIIGRNGSGKSTLLRAVAGLIPPTSGQVWADGSPALLGVSSVLVKSMSGARNIYIGAQALGLSRQEVDEVFDEIVDFSGLGDAIHLPMSTYSSGMASRLRFAISTASSPSVLVIDEALATGDTHFRQKSSERVARLRENASTVFLVSHSAGSIREMCERAIWLDEGSVVADGPARDVVAAYSTGRKSWGLPVSVHESPVAGVDRWSHADRFAALATCSKRALEPGLDALVLAPGSDMQRALALVPAISRAKAGLLVCQPDVLPPQVGEELGRLKPRALAVLGTRAEVVDSTVRAAATTSGGSAERLAGLSAGDLTLAAEEWLREHQGAAGAPAEPARVVYVVLKGDQDATILAATSAAHDGGRVLVVDPSVDQPGVHEMLRGLREERVLIVGDDDDGELQMWLEEIVPSGVSVSVLMGVTAEQRALAATQAIPDGSAGTVHITSPAAAPNVINAMLAAGHRDEPFLFVEHNAISPQVRAELERLRPRHIVVHGGQPTVSPAIRTALAEFVHPD